jgi:hypothetical protein
MNLSDKERALVCLTSCVGKESTPTTLYRMRTPQRKSDPRHINLRGLCLLYYRPWDYANTLSFPLSLKVEGLVIATSGNDFGCNPVQAVPIGAESGDGVILSHPRRTLACSEGPGQVARSPLTQLLEFGGFR